MKTRQPFTCPVCRGKGLVPNGFYNQTSWNWVATDATPEKCSSCKNGIIWYEEPEGNEEILPIKITITP